MAYKYALIIACSQYQDSRLRQLPKTEADATGVKNVLIDPLICGFPEANVESLINEQDGRIKIAIERFFKNRQKDDLLVLYFAGHGVIDDQRKLILALNETDPEYRSTGIEARFLRDEMENSRCQQQILILDCCNAGAFAKARDTKGAPAGFQETLKGKGLVVFAASDTLQFSFDEVEGREDINNGVFTHYLIEGLRDFNAVSADGFTVTANSLYNYAHEKVAEVTERRQTPALILPDEKRIGDIVLAQKPAPALPSELHSLLDDTDYTQRLRGIHKLGDAIRDGEVTPQPQKTRCEKCPTSLSTGRSTRLLTTFWGKLNGWNFGGPGKSALYPRTCKDRQWIWSNPGRQRINGGPHLQLCYCPLSSVCTPFFRKTAKSIACFRIAWKKNKASKKRRRKLKKSELTNCY